MAIYLNGGGINSTCDIRQDVTVSAAALLTDCAHTCAILRSNWPYYRTERKVLKAVHIYIYIYTYIEHNG